MNNFLYKLFENMCSVKVWIIIVASAFRWYDKLSGELWAQVVLVVAGFRAANEITSIIKQGNDTDKGG